MQNVRYTLALALVVLGVLGFTQIPPEHRPIVAILLVLGAWILLAAVQQAREFILGLLAWFFFGIIFATLAFLCGLILGDD